MSRAFVQEAEPQTRIVYKIHKTTKDMPIHEVRRTWLAVDIPSEDGDELVVADLDLSMIDEVRQTWQFYRDRRPDAYDELVD